MNNNIYKLILLPFSELLCSLSVKGQLTSCRIKGHLVTITIPLGKNDLPTILSITELLPELCKKKK